MLDIVYDFTCSCVLSAAYGVINDDDDEPGIRAAYTLKQ